MNLPLSLALAAVLAGVVVLALILLVALRASAASRSVGQLDELRTLLEAVRASSDRIERESRADSARDRGELAARLAEFSQVVSAQFGAQTSAQGQRLDAVSQQLAHLTQSIEQRLEAIRATVEHRLELLRSDNAAKLDLMRATVDEKLHTALELRLGQTFNLVSERLEQVQKGLGEMQSLAAGVGDLKKVLTNVKTRGTWGEIQLGNLLEQILSPEQYQSNVATCPNSNERVEFAIKLPGQGGALAQVWLPIDAKFPLEDFQRLQEAQDAGESAAVEAQGRALENRIRIEARTVREKYVEPPFTTDFAILYLPVEGLYAEVLRRPGLADSLQRELHVVLAGPTTLAAMLNSLQMGFRTLAIEQRTSEVWVVLGAVKTEFAKFGDILARTRKKLDEASNVIGDAETRTRQIARRLRSVDAVAEPEAAQLIEQNGAPELDGGAPDGDLFAPR